eukprot:TRINITY_DN11387_c0_g2_i20.p2 TRINITY_DN11387_c0_g2~~TRINITY_DN11387_c0_g2_i20.p2  ORF type:complete len:123 (-),score=29.69 TRINITY_DN11387_c0_g2_i20:211-579(-)
MEEEESVTNILETFIKALAELRRNSGVVIALRYLFETVNNKSTTVGETLVRFLKKLISNLPTTPRETSTSKSPSSRQTPRSPVPEHHSEELVLSSAPIVLGVTINICRLDSNELNVCLICIV